MACALTASPRKLHLQISQHPPPARPLNLSLPLSLSLQHAYRPRPSSFDKTGTRNAKTAHPNCSRKRREYMTGTSLPHRARPKNKTPSIQQDFRELEPRYLATLLPHIRRSTPPSEPTNAGSFFLIWGKSEDPYSPIDLVNFLLCELRAEEVAMV